MKVSNSTVALQSAGPTRNDTRSHPSRYEKYLIVAFFLSLPLSNPWVHGDGVGYYALARSLLIEHRLDFQNDWLEANPQFRMAHTDAQGRLLAGGYTATNHLNNHFAIGPAILWSPFLVAAHAGVLIGDGLGAHLPANGFSRPYVVAMALGTALYGFLALWISFDIARRYVAERWAFLATIGIWFASSLPVYMYFNPSWSHAHSAFAVALFLWYWNKTRDTRTLRQWILLGLIAGLMIDVYYVSAVVLLLPFFEFVAHLRAGLFKPLQKTWPLILNGALFAGAALMAFLPTLITKKIIFGSYFNLGYTERWYWNSPALLKVCFSSEHGLFSWTPIIIPAVVGLFFLARHDRNLARYLLVVFAVYLYAIGCYQDWAGIASFGNRFFVSLTPLFVLGLAALFDRFAPNLRRSVIVATTSIGLLVLWNLGMIYQWGVHLIPARGPISWRQAAYNQFAVVPGRVIGSIEDYLVHRGRLMQHIENEDMKQLKSYHPD
jgi:Dolichyl-phosphate-mannose-protein mannosyltransferase